MINVSEVRSVTSQALQ